MNYADVLNDFFDICRLHKMIRTVGYGNLTDLVEPLKREPKTNLQASNRKPEKVYGIDYPYAFINPTNHTLTKNASTYRFNLIMMEQCDDDTMEVVQAQSECHQYIKDILAHLYYNYGEKYDFNLNSTITPFKEKYNDTVSGMTAQIEVIIRDPLDDCITPFLPAENVLVLAIDDSGEELIEVSSPLWFEADPINDGGWDRIRYRVTNPVPQEYYFDIDFSVRFNQPLSGNTLSYFLQITQDINQPTVLDELPIEETFESVNKVYRYRHTFGPFTLEPDAGGNDVFFRIQSNDAQPQSPDAWQVAGQLRIYTLN